MKHTFHNCNSPDCFTCNGGLSYCDVCKGAEGGLPTECSGKPLSQEELDDVYAGRKDFINNIWISKGTVVKQHLTFNTLRVANALRLPQFKNKHGRAAHEKADGSDWTPAQWLQALIGELGEWATVRLQFEAGELTAEEYAVKSAKELADVQTYLDIMAMRSLDITTTAHKFSPPNILMQFIAALGEYANVRKKWDRKDLDIKQYTGESRSFMDRASGFFYLLSRSILDDNDQEVTFPHLHGVDLGEATVLKFNEVTERVGSTVFIVTGEENGLYSVFDESK